MSAHEAHRHALWQIRSARFFSLSVSLLFLVVSNVFLADSTWWIFFIFLAIDIRWKRAEKLKQIMYLYVLATCI